MWDIKRQFLSLPAWCQYGITVLGALCLVGIWWLLVYRQLSAHIASLQNACSLPEHYAGILGAAHKDVADMKKRTQELVEQSCDIIALLMTRASELGLAVSSCVHRTDGRTELKAEGSYEAFIAFLEYFYARCIRFSCQSCSLKRVNDRLLTASIVFVQEG